MKIALLTLSDGRADYLARTLAAAGEMLPEVDHRIHIDDSDHALGFAGAIKLGWEEVLRTDADFVFHLEDDFLLKEPVPLDRMARVLVDHPYLLQLALKRQPWNKEERAAGGVVECHPNDFIEHRRFGGEEAWTEHRRYFTTNPSLYPVRLCRLGWPQVPHSEGIFTHRLLRHAVWFGLWGGKFDPPKCEHIGGERAGHGY